MCRVFTYIVCCICTDYSFESFTCSSILSDPVYTKINQPILHIALIYRSKPPSHRAHIHNNRRFVHEMDGYILLCGWFFALLCFSKNRSRDNVIGSLVYASIDHSRVALNSFFSQHSKWNWFDQRKLVNGNGKKPEHSVYFQQLWTYFYTSHFEMTCMFYYNSSWQQREEKKTIIGKRWLGIHGLSFDDVSMIQLYLVSMDCIVILIHWWMKMRWTYRSMGTLRKIKIITTRMFFCW